MRCAAVILAAGRSSRMGSNKLLEVLRGKPMLEHVLLTTEASVARPMVLVSGHQAEAVTAVAAGFPVEVVLNPRFAEGLSTSLRAGIAALPGDVEAAVVLLGDMPDVTPGLIDRLVAALGERPDAIAAVPSLDGAWGNPVVLSRSLFEEVTRLSGDAGARKLLEGRAERVVVVPVDDAAVALDLDTPEALAAARAKH
jgi:molybdenum cofactor cytidylyltransferase